MPFKEINFAKLAIGWMIFFTVACLANSVFIIVYQMYDKGGSLAFLPPFVHMGAVILCVVGMYFLKGRAMWQSEYIWQKYPHIARRIYPEGDYTSHNAYRQVRVIKIVPLVIF